MNAIAKITDRLNELSTKHQIIEIDGGILVHMIHDTENLNTLKDQILHICVEEHKKLLPGKSAFPFKIFCYRNEDEAYCVEAAFKTKLNDYSNNSVLTMYQSVDDAYILMREIDAEAIIFNVKKPFSFNFKENNDLFSFSELGKYKALSFSGFSFEFDGFKEVIFEGKSIWKVIMV